MQLPAIAVTIVLLSIGFIPFAEGTTMYPLKIGQNRSFNDGELNYRAILYACADSRCGADLTSRIATGAVRLSDESATARTGERGLGWQFQLETACAGQSTAAGMDLIFGFDYDLAATATPILGTSAAAVYARATASGTAQATTAVPALSATRPTSSGTVSGDSIHNTVANGSIYQAVITGRGTATLADTLLPGEFADARAKVSPKTLTVDFKDVLPPTTQSRIVPAGHDATGTFLGYQNSSSVELYVQATDPSVGAGGTAVGQSCVKQVHIEDNSQSDILPVNFNQDEVASGRLFTEEGRHDLTVFARDYANLQPSNPAITYFVLDRIAPNATAQVDRVPNGFDQWYANTSPRWLIGCIRDPTGLGLSNTAPCDEIDYSKNGGGSWTTIPATDEGATLTADQGASVNILARSRDAAGNTGAAVVSNTIKVDTGKPVVSITTSATSPFGNGWYRDPGNITFRCVSDAISGCGIIETSPNGTPYQPVTTYICTTDLLLNIGFKIFDLAGNLVAGTVQFGCDFTAPQDTTVTFGNTYFNSDRNRTYTNRTPTISWPAAVDPITNGVASGIQKYEIELNGVAGHAFPNSTNSSWTLSSVGEGQNCVRLRGIDKANNKAPWSAQKCVFVDRILPAADFFSPGNNTLTVYETTVIPIANPPQPIIAGESRWINSIVIGKAMTGIRGTDSGSRLYNLSLIEDIYPFYDPDSSEAYRGPAYFNPPTNNDDIRWDNNRSAPGCVNVNLVTADCSWYNGRGDHPQSLTPELHLMYGRVVDNAQNERFMFRNYTRVNTALIETLCTGTVGPTCNTVFFANALEMKPGLSPEKFVQYIAYAVPDDGVLTRDATQLAGVSTDINQPFIKDVSVAHRQVGKTYRYEVFVQLTDDLLGTGSEAPTYAKPTIVYRGQAGNFMSEWLSARLQQQYQ